MALFTELWNAGRHRMGNLSWNKHTTLAQLDPMGLTVNGSALPSPKRLRAGRSKVLQENPPYGPGFIFTGI